MIWILQMAALAEVLHIIDENSPSVDFLSSSSSAAGQQPSGQQQKTGVSGEATKQEHFMRSEQV